MAERRRGVTTLTVLRTEWPAPHLVRVHLGGPGLASFTDNGFTDKYVKLMFPRPGVAYPPDLDLDVIRRDFPRADWPVTRTYTVRSYDRDAGELAIDFVTHGDEGIAAPWAAAAKPGDEVIVRGPGGAYAPSTEADAHVLVGDESALPAVGAALEAVPAGKPVLVFALVEDEAERVALPVTPDTRVTWLHRVDHASAGDAGDALVDAVRGADFPAGAVQAFVHGEAGFVAELRRHLIADRAVPRDLLSVSGYWRRGKNEDGWQAEKAETRRLEEAAAG
jgi:NADPH-dependent ferric siderophore reductase